MAPLPGLAGLLPGELAELLGLPPFRGVQIFKWISRGALSFDSMTDLPLSLRETLAEKYRIRTGSVKSRLEAPDGTVKSALAFGGGAGIEMVLLEDGRGRKTVCLSTQAGCPAGCVFCKTGTLGFRRNLSAAEIAEQFLFAGDLAPGISSVVVMGMGEPLLNLAELRRACAFLCHRDGPGISPRRITVSTCGIADGIRDLASGGPPVRLALSLATADEELRRALMPITKANPLPLLKEALLYFQERGGGRVTLEAVLLGGINTGRKDARAMAAFARGLDVVVNIIPWNPVEGLVFSGLPLREPSAGETAEFRRLLEQEGLKVTRRYRRGRGVSGACGQLGESACTCAEAPRHGRTDKDADTPMTPAQPAV
ncbi:MAG: 23S rRNA (adenine(2503)-C(2))-methyltransferase RlmN [Treponema sp.]|jgi:23S rRNA (adenine2503-C2)-methyltransferase|nr:23S rRNA (adenine(2503)-C(2))-methyltransferase RlmN [Treponema sp.]